MCLDTNHFCLNLHRDLTCPICLGALCINSVIDENEHAFCRICILKWLKNGNSQCPCGNEPLESEKLRPIPRIVKNLLSDSQVYCKFNEIGCKLAVKYENVLKHEANCSYCPRRKARNARFDERTMVIENDALRTAELVKLPSNSLYRMILFNNATEILMPDELNSLIHICDLNGNLVDSINPEGLLDQPIGLCALNVGENTEELFIGDCAEHKIFVFDVNFVYKRQFGNDTLKIPQYIVIDTEETKHLYASDYYNNEISVWDTETDSLVDIISIHAPFTIKISKEYLFIVSPAEFKIVQAEADENNNNKNSNKIETIEKGSNCIFILSKQKSYEILREIKFNNWLCPSALHVTFNMNIYTVAYELDENGYKSDFKNLFIIDLNGDLIRKIKLNDIQIIGDMIVLHNKLLFSVRNAIRILNF